MRNSRIARGLLLPAALVFWLSACHQWVDLEPPFGPAIETDDTPDRLRVTVQGGQAVLEAPEVRGDTLIGGKIWDTMEHLAYRRAEEPDVMRIPLDDVLRVEARKGNTSSTTGAAILGISVVLGVLVVAVSSDFGSFGP